MSGYHYVGPAHLVRENHERVEVTCQDDLARWFLGHQQDQDAQGYVPATYIMDLAHRLWMADRRSEHVACAHGQPVLAAGELYIEKDGRNFRLARLSNQSTGYCPPVETWSVVEEFLVRQQIDHAPGFDPACEFRACDSCRELQIVKNGDFTCSFCENTLPHDWNINNR